MVPFHTPVAIVPSDVMFNCVAEGMVELMDGTPPPLVIKTPLLPVASPETTVPADA